MADQILFNADVCGWVCIKKASVTADTPKTEVSRILASIQESLGRKAFDFLSDDLDFDQLDAVVREVSGAEIKDPEAKKPSWVVKGKVDEQKVAQVLACLNSPTTSRRIKEALRVKTKSAVEIAKTYVTLGVFDMLGFRLALDPKIVEKHGKEKNELSL